MGPFVSRKERLSSRNIKDFTNVYIKNLSESISEEDLHKYFGKYGPLKSGIIMRDEQGKSKGFAFINFDNADAATKVCTDKCMVPHLYPSALKR